MASLASDVTNSLWHAFNALDEHKTGQVPKSKLKVLTANLGTVLQTLNVENGLQDHRSTQYLQFEDYLFYLQRELFTSTPCVSTEPRNTDRYREQVEEMCWLVCRKQFLTRDKQLFPDSCVYQLFRIFCCLAELVPCPEQLIQVVLSADEVSYVAQTFVTALGHNWDRIDFEQIARVIPTFRFPVFLALLETRYSQNVEIAGLVEAVQELFDTFIKDVIKKGFLSKRGHFLPIWKDVWFVLQPNCLTYYSSRAEKEKRGEFPISSKCAIENIPEMPNSRPNRFSICYHDKCFELHATDQKTKLQWILALQTAIEHSGMRESYQKRLLAKRKTEREALNQRRHDEELKHQMQQQLLEKQQAELEIERLARQAAEQQAQKQAALREAETKQLKELEEGKKELEQLLMKERQAKQDEEIVRNLQARVLREEWEKREELEKLRDEQGRLLDEERSKREGLQLKTQENGEQLENALEKLKQLEEERMRLDTQLKESKIMLVDAQRHKDHLEENLKDAQEKMVAAERAKEVLEAKLKVRERSLIPIFMKSNSASKLTSPVEFNRRKSPNSISPRLEMNKNHTLPEEGELDETD